MEKIIKFPREIKNLIENYGISQEDILFFTPTDMGVNGSLIKGYIILTRKDLGVIISEPNINDIYEFKGSESLKSKSVKTPREWIFRLLPIKDIRRLDVLPIVSGGILYAEKEDEQDSIGFELQLTGCSNRYLGDVILLTKLFREVKDGVELKEDYIGEKQEEYCPKCEIIYPDKERKVCPKCMNKQSIFFRVLKYFKPHSKKVVIMVICYFLMAVLNLVWPYFNGTILYDKVLAQNETFLEFLGIANGNFVAALGLIILTMVITKMMMQGIGILQGCI